MNKIVYEAIIKNYDNSLKREVKLVQYQNELEPDDEMDGADYDAVDRSFFGYSSISQQEALKNLFNYISAQSQEILELCQLPIFKSIDWSDSPDAAGIEYTAQINLETGELVVTDEVVHPLLQFKEFEGTCQCDDEVNIYAISYESAYRAKQHLLNGLNERHSKFLEASLNLGSQLHA